MNFSDPLLNFSFTIRRFHHSPMFRIHHVPKLQRDQREVRWQVILLQIWYIWPLVVMKFFIQNFLFCKGESGIPGFFISYSVIKGAELCPSVHFG